MPGQGHFLQGELPRADRGEAFRAVPGLDVFYFPRRVTERRVPAYPFHFTPFVFYQRQGIAFCVKLLVQGKPLDTGKAPVHRVILCGVYFGDAPVFNKKINITTQGTVITGGLYFVHDPVPPMLRVAMRRKLNSTKAIIAVVSHTWMPAICRTRGPHAP